MTLYFRLIWVTLISLLGSRVSPFESVKTRFRVWPTDLDIFGHMTNSRYFNLMDLGRNHLIARAGMLSSLARRGWYPVVVEEAMQFRRSLHPFERFVLETRIVGFDERHFSVHQTFRVGEKVAAVGIVRARFLSKQGERISPRQVLDLWERDGVSVHPIPTPEEDMHEYLQSLSPRSRQAP